MFNSGRVRRNGFQDSQINTIQQRLTQAAEARNEEAKGKVLYTGEMNISDEEAAKLPFAYIVMVMSITLKPMLIRIRHFAIP